MDVSAIIHNRLLHIIRDGTNVQAIKDILSDVIQDTDDVTNYILDHLSVDEAEGELLEFLGEIIGLARPKAQEDPDRIFTLKRVGETDDPDKGLQDDSDPSVTTGGYMMTLTGLESVTDPDSEMSDSDYRYFIYQKAAAYRSKMTHLNLYNYLLAFGARCELTESAAMTVLIEPFNYYDMDNWQKNYAVTRGFKPAGISLSFVDMLNHESEI